MSFDWLRNVDGGSSAPKHDPEENISSDSNHDDVSTRHGFIHSSPNSLSPQHGPSGFGLDNTHLSRMQEARKYGFRTNINRNPRGSGYVDTDKSGNYGVEIDETDDDSSSKGLGRKLKAELVPMPQSCTSCTRFAMECSILDDPTQYPCTICCEEDLCCILPNPITPEAKAGTAAAKKEEKRKEKEKEKKEKEAERAKEVANRKRAKQVAKQKIKPEDRRYVACAPCRREGSACSLRKRSQIGPCNKCMAQGTPCTFEAKVIKKAKEENAARRHSSSHKHRSSSASRRHSKAHKSRSKSSSSGPIGQIPKGMIKKTIKTYFCHPITFNNVQDPNEPSNLNPCHFHTTTAFALLGLGPKVVDVLAPRNPSPESPFQYTECSDGHASSGEPATAMCIPCTFSRQRIITCKNHSIRALAGVGAPCNFDYHGAFSRILADQQAGFNANTAAAVRWCSVCPAPAFFECCASARYDANGDRLVAQNDIGCGLLLCEVCAGELCGPSKTAGLLDDIRKEEAVIRELENAKTKIGYSGVADDARIEKRKALRAVISLDKLVDRARHDIFKYDEGPRADAGFLTTEGELSLWAWSLLIPEEDKGIEAPAEEHGIEGPAEEHGVEGYSKNMETEQLDENMEDAGYQSDGSHWEF